MKIAVNTDNHEVLNSMIRTAKEHGNTIIITKLEKALFDRINTVEEDEVVDAYVITSGSSYAQKAVDFIKKEFPYAPVVIIGKDGKYNINSADIIVPFEADNNTDFLAKSILHNIYAYSKNFEILQRLTAKMGDKINFGKGTFDPIKKILFYDGKEIQKLSPKMAGVFELLSSNFGKIVKKDVIMEKVWHQSNYFVDRSLDVFVSHIRKIFENHGVPLTITNVSNIGLMLDYSPNAKK